MGFFYTPPVVAEKPNLPPTEEASMPLTKTSMGSLNGNQHLNLWKPTRKDLQKQRKTKL